ncbi:MAG: PAS domain S-box protein [Candidatus Methylacidiphilales bacterium]|nr:PAS domain S-box protein [Candidatus Methylacidiphilales bacterium]
MNANSPPEVLAAVEPQCTAIDPPLEVTLAATRQELFDLRAALNEHAIVAITDSRGRITFANDKFCSISQYSREELIGKDHRIINSGHHSKEFIRDLWATISQGRVWKGEILNRGKYGTLYWVDTTIVPFLDSQGKPHQYYAIRADITERKKAEERLLASHKEVNDLRDALDQHAIVAITNPQGQITFVNDKFCSISKYSREELLGQDHRIINSGHHPRKFFTDLWRTLAHGKVWHGEIKNRAKDGTFYWVDTTIVPFLDQHGKPTQYVAIRADITTRKEMEDALRESESRFRTMADSIPQLAWMAEANGYLVWYNKRWYEYTGKTPEETEGWGWQSVHHPDTLLTVMEKWRASLALGEPFEMEFPLRRRDGRFFPFLTRVQPMRDAEGRIVRWFGTNTDITDIKQAEERLEQRVAQRTAELESANKELEAFSYSVSHDLRSPLRAIDGFSQAILEDCADLLPIESREDLMTVRQAAQKMGVLIDDLLKFSRLSRAPLNRSEVDMEKMVRGILYELKPEHAGRAIEISIESLPSCSADAPLLHQVWVNLISNAIKYTKKVPAARIEIGFSAKEKGDAYFVRDNGAGFSMKYAGKLFGVFQRLHRQEEYEGTGVGLAIVQRILLRHGGIIWAEAEVNRGATFYFNLGIA